MSWVQILGPTRERRSCPLTFTRCPLINTCHYKRPQNKLTWTPLELPCAHSVSPFPVCTEAVHSGLKGRKGRMKARKSYKKITPQCWKRANFKRYCLCEKQYKTSNHTLSVSPLDVQRPAGRHYRTAWGMETWGETGKETTPTQLRPLVIRIWCKQGNRLREVQPGGRDMGILYIFLFKKKKISPTSGGFSCHEQFCQLTI